MVAIGTGPAQVVILGEGLCPAVYVDMMLMTLFYYKVITYNLYQHVNVIMPPVSSNVAETNTLSLMYLKFVVLKSFSDLLRYRSAAAVFF